MTPFPPASLAVELTAQFAAWECRGRGWDLADERIALEPAFVPFRYRLPEEPGRSPDDGRSPGLLEALGSFFSARFRQASLPVLPAPLPRVREPWEHGLPCEFRVMLPPGTRISRDVTEQFLISLGHCAAPVAFEIIGTSEAVVFQFACAAADASSFRDLLSAYFPEILLLQTEAHVATAWHDTGVCCQTVDFGLSEEFMLPLRSWRSYDPDPLLPVISALADLQQEELAIFQVLFQPARFPWGESVLNSVLLADDSPFFVDAPELSRGAREKLRTPLYAVCVRAGARCCSEKRNWAVLRSIAGALAQFAAPEGNEYLPLSGDGYSGPEDHAAEFLDRTTRRTGMLLNLDELLCLVHLPSASVRASKVVRDIERTKAVPALCAAGTLRLGWNCHAGERRPAVLSPEQRTRHLYVIGASGTGKSNFLLNLIRQDIESGQGIAVLDPHGDLIDRILERIPEERFDDVILIDPADEEFPVGFNILQAHSELEKTLLSSDLIAVFRRLATSWGDQMNSVFSNAIAAFLESSRGGTLSDLRRFLVDPAWREEFLETVADGEIAYYWHREFPLLKGGGSLGPILTRLDTFLRPKLVRRMVGQRESRLDFAGIMNGGKICLARLSQGAVGEENAYLLGTLLISKFHQLALSRQELRAEARRPFWLYVDECHNFITPSMASILSGTRKYRLGLVLANQDLRQLQRDPEVASALLSNAYTRVSFRVGDADARSLADGFSYFEARDLQNLGIGEAIARVERAEFDFNLSIPELEPVDGEIAHFRAHTIRSLSRARYATPREEVDAALAAELEAREREAAKPSGRKSKAKPRPIADPSEPSESGATQGEEPAPLRVLDAPIAETVPAPEPPDVGRGSASPRQAAPPPIPAAPRAKSAEAAPGRGGREHKYLQQLIKQWAEGMGWRATVEKQLDDGRGSVDVALEKDGRPSVACEITVTTTPEWEFGNILKCLNAGFGFVAVVSASEKKLQKIRALAEDACGPAPDSVIFVTPERLFAFVEELEAKAASPAPATVRGYKVTVNLKPDRSGEGALRQQAISKILLDSVRKSRGSR